MTKKTDANTDQNEEVSKSEELSNVEDILEAVSNAAAEETVAKNKRARRGDDASKLKKDLEEMTGFAQRAKADLENIKKRNQNIAAEMYVEGKRDTVLKILPIVDNFDRALAIEMDENVKTGFANIRKMFTEILGKMGVKEIECMGLEFDAAYHNALMQVDDADNSGKVVNVFEKGYLMNDKVLRHASVVVAK